MKRTRLFRQEALGGIRVQISGWFLLLLLFYWELNNCENCFFIEFIAAIKMETRHKKHYKVIIK